MNRQNSTNGFYRPNLFFEQKSPDNAGNHRGECKARKICSAWKKQCPDKVTGTVNRCGTQGPVKMGGEHYGNKRESEFKIPKLNGKKPRKNNLQRGEDGKADESFKGVVTSFFQEKNLLFSRC